MTTKEVTNAHGILFWNSTHCLRDAVNDAFDKAGYPHLKPRPNYMAVLKRTAQQLVRDYLDPDSTLRMFALSGHESEVGVEVRQYIKGEKKNDLPHLLSVGVTKDHKLTILKWDEQQRQHSQHYLEERGNEILQHELKYVEAADITVSIAALIKHTHGFMLRDGGSVWYCPVESLGPYEAVAKHLKRFGVILNCVQFKPELNDALLNNIGDQLIHRAETVINGTVDEVTHMMESNKRMKPNGRASRLDKITQAQRTVEANSELVGRWAEAFQQACSRAKELVGEAALGQFASLK